jgi:hypothetical protein
MGKISNLITDMSLAGAPSSEMVRAVKHSMVVIDAEKHGLDYKLSANDNNIKQLKKKYQPAGGGSTIISRARARIDVPYRVDRPASEGGPINKVTGEREYKYLPDKTSYKTGKPRTIKSKKLAEVRDAFDLVQGHPMEIIYANHANKLMALANRARLDYVNTPTPKQSPSAKKAYAKEVASLDAKLDLALRNRPLERQAQLLANVNIKARHNANPGMDSDTRKKIEYQALQEARVRVGARKNDIEFTDSEWDAIQAGAVSTNKLTQMLDKANMENVYAHATPKDQILMTPAKTARAAAMLAAGYDRAQVAAHLGVSLSTLDKGMHE